MSPPPRRRVLAALGVATTAGCLGSLTGDSDDGVRLGSLRLERARETEGEYEDVTERELDGDATDVDDGWTFPIRLSREGDVVFQDGVTLRQGEYVVVEPTWSTAPATYELLYGWPDGVDRLAIPEETQEVDPEACNYVYLQAGHPGSDEHPLVWVRPAGDRRVEGLDGLVCE